MEMKEKDYVQAYIVKKSFDNGSFVLNANLKTKELLNHTNKEGWVALTIAERQNVSETGATHYAYINEFTPDPNYSSKNKKSGKDLPF